MTAECLDPMWAAKKAVSWADSSAAVMAVPKADERVATTDDLMVAVMDATMAVATAAWLAGTMAVRSVAVMAVL